MGAGHMYHDPSSEAIHLKGQRCEKSTRPGEVVMITDGCQQSKGSSFTFDDLAGLDKVNDCYTTYPGTNPDEPEPAGPNMRRRFLRRHDSMASFQEYWSQLPLRGGARRVASD